MPKSDEPLQTVSWTSSGVAASWNLYIPVILESQRENDHQSSRQVQRLDDPVPKWKLTIVLI